MKQVTFNDQLLAVIDVATRILAARLLSVIGLAMTFGLFCWAMWLQTVLGFAIAGGFALCVFLPALIGERRAKETENGSQE